MAVAAFHQLLLRLAGWVPDELLCAARDQLVRGATGDVAAMIGYAAQTVRIPLADADVELLRAAIGSVPPVVRAGARPGIPPVVFSAEPPPAVADEYPLTGPAGPDGTDGLDEVDRTCAEVIELESEGTARAVWRVWRSPDRPSGWPPPRRVVLIQATADGDLLALIAARLQEVLVHAGERTPQVEVFAEADRLPSYQRAALASAVLVWAGRSGADPVTSVRPRVARLFDPGVQPGFASDRERLDEPERGKVLAFLSGGSPVLATDAVMDDVLGSGHGVVPMTCRSDGTWVWSDGVAYYLRTYAVAPEADFLWHIRAAGYRADPIDTIAVHQAVAAVTAVETGRPW
ncbi:hypothetical protein [Dactylosporangium sp. NPDC048998]|uniref:hypothetical protein n=1 Tax=Dactylosporangium sp. NPDC048998 TaxID=3363976 RepID=UPI003721F7FD